MESRKHFEMLLKMRPNDYLPIPFIAQMLGTDESEIRRLIRRNAFRTIPLSRRSHPRLGKVKSIESDTPYYIFRDGIRALVKIVETKKAEAIFALLCERSLSVKADVKFNASHSRILAQLTD